MSATRHAPPPIPLPRDDKQPSPSSPVSPPLSRSPTYSRSNDVRPNDVKPVIVANPPKGSPPPPTKAPLPSTSESSRPSSPSTPAPRAAAQDSVPTPQEEDGEVIDMDTFLQILELDEDDPEFSREMVWAYFSQAETTFEQLDSALSQKDLPTLSSLGHFFKGSSAALGVTRVQDSCAKIQHYGHLKDQTGQADIGSDEALDLIKKTLIQVKKDYAVAEKWLKDYYKDLAEDS